MCIVGQYKRAGYVFAFTLSRPGSFLAQGNTTSYPENPKSNSYQPATRHIVPWIIRTSVTHQVLHAVATDQDTNR